MNPFLKAKHWQIFVPLFGIPILIQFWWMDKLFSAIPKPGDDPEMVDEVFLGSMADVLPLIFGVAALIMLVQFGWFFSVAFGLRKYTPIKERLRILPIVVSIVIPFMYALLVGQFLYQLFKSDFAIPNWFHGGAVGLLFLMHFIALACIFYAVYYTAKAFKTALLKRKVNREEVVGEFFMILFLFARIWELQPRINQIIEGEINPEAAESGDPDFSKYSN